MALARRPSRWRAVIALGACLGAAHGLLVTRLRLQPFIVTLCGLLLYRGAARYIAARLDEGIRHRRGFEWVRALASGSVGGVPMPFVLMCVVAGLAWLLLHRSVFGRHLFAIGHNEEAARYSGVNTRAVDHLGLRHLRNRWPPSRRSSSPSTRTRSRQPRTAISTSSMRLPPPSSAAAACAAAKARSLGIVMGAALLQVLRNLVNLLDIPGSLDFAVMGAVILIGATADQLFGRRLRRDDGTGTRFRHQ